MTVSTQRKSELAARIVAAASAAFIGVGALFGGYELLSDAEGFGLPEAWLEGTPFPDYQVPGLFLFVVIGVGGIATAALTLAHHRWWAAATLALGSILAAWLLIETALIGWRGDQQALLLIITGIPSVVMMLIGWRRGALDTVRGILGR